MGGNKNADDPRAAARLLKVAIAEVNEGRDLPANTELAGAIPILVVLESEGLDRAQVASHIFNEWRQYSGTFGGGPTSSVLMSLGQECECTLPYMPLYQRRTADGNVEMYCGHEEEHVYLPGRDMPC